MPNIQYCRYCQFCMITPADECWCLKQNRCIKTATAKAKNYCKDYEHTSFDVFDPQKVYRPDKDKQEKSQINFIDLLGEDWSNKDAPKNNAI